MYLMIRTFEERWNVEYLSGVTNEVVELVSVSSIHLRKRAEIPEPPGIPVGAGNGHPIRDTVV
jgi:hypothetical protein